MHEYGLLRPSFIPDAQVAALRQRTRYRKKLIEQRSSEGQRLAKVLEDAGIKIDSVASDMLGKSGRAMIEALIAGERDPVRLAGLALDTPPDAIARNGRARRRWHKLTGLTGAMAVMAGTALAVTALAPSGHPASQSGRPASHPRTAQLAAWTVAKQGNGDIKVTIRQLSDPSGLQSTLRADGVPASVTSLAQPDPSCRPYPMSQALFTSVYHADKTAASGDTVLIIDPSALPSGAGVQIGAATGQQVGDRGLRQAAVNQTIHHSVHQPVHQAAARAHNVAIRVGLVYGSQQCTGS